MKLIGLVIMVVALAFGGGERACAHAGAAMSAAHAMDHQGADDTTMDDAASSPMDHATHSDAPIKGELMDRGSHDGLAGGCPDDCSEDCPDHCNGGRDCAGCAAVSPAIVSSENTRETAAPLADPFSRASFDMTHILTAIEPPVPKGQSFL